jgi:hypothetical protein
VGYSNPPPHGVSNAHEPWILGVFTATYARANGTDFFPFSSCLLYNPIALFPAWFHASFLLDLFSDTEAGEMFHLNVG